MNNNACFEERLRIFPDKGSFSVQYIKYVSSNHYKHCGHYMLATTKHCMMQYIGDYTYILLAEEGSQTRWG